MLIGRESDLAAVDSALAEHRLVTLTGPGGVGKTALAREILSSTDDRETYFADLTPLGGEIIEEGVAGSLRFRSFDEMLTVLATHPGLLVLDNCEHVLDAAASLAVRLLDAAPRLTVLATSREALAIEEERVMAVDPLDTTGSPSPAEALLLREARRRGFDDAVASRDDVVALCRRLDGLPLALELAATRLAALTPHEILDHLSDRLDLLTRARSRGPDRHQSLSAAIGWSYALLDPDHRTLLAELSVLPSPFALDTVIAVSELPDPAVIDGLVALTERSLIGHTVSDGRSAYHMLDTIRMFGAEKLGDAGGAVEDRLYGYALSVADEIAGAASRAEPVVTRRLGELYRVLRWALVRSVAEQPDPVDSVRLVAAWWWLEDVGHQSEAADTVETVVARWSASDRLGPTWGVLAGLHRYAGRRERALEAAEIAVTYHDLLGRAYGLRTIGQFARTDGRWDDAAAAFIAGVEAAREVGHEAIALEIELHLAITEARSGGVEAGIERMERIAERTERYQLVHVVGSAFRAWLWVARDDEIAERTAREALAEAERLAYQWGVGSAHLTLGAIAMRRTALADAAAHAYSAITTFRQIRDRTGITVALLLASAVLNAAGDLELAVAASAARREHLAWQLGPFERWLFDELGAEMEVDDDAEAAPLSVLTERLQEIAEEEAPLPPRMIVGAELSAITYAGATVQLRTTKGLRDLATLLGRPGHEVAALDLMGAKVVAGDAGPVIDAEARRRYEARIRELRDQIESAEAFGDEAAAERYRHELDLLVDELGAAYGLGGRARRVGDPAERARSAVTHRIRDAIRRMEQIHPELSAHLLATVKTGIFCVYDAAVAWQVEIEAQSTS